MNLADLELSKQSLGNLYEKLTEGGLGEADRYRFRKLLRQSGADYKREDCAFFLRMVKLVPVLVYNTNEGNHPHWRKHWQEKAEFMEEKLG